MRFEALRAFKRSLAMAGGDQESCELDSLLLRVARADRAAFDALYNSTAARMFGVALRILKDRSDAEDVVQEAFVKVWRRATLYVSSSDGAPLQWLTSVVRNTAIDWRRRRRHLNADPSIDVADDAPTPEAAAAARADARLLLDCLAALEADKARLVRKAYFNGMSYSELSRAEDTPIGTMKSWMRRALFKLRECMEGEPLLKSGDGQ